MLSAKDRHSARLDGAATAPSFAMTDKSRQSNRDTSMWRLLALASAALRTPQCARLYASTASVLLPPPSVGSLARHTNWPSAATAPARHRVRAYVTVSGRGTWLFAPSTEFWFQQLDFVWSRQSSSHAFCSRMRHACSSAAKCKPWHILIITPLNCASGHCTSASLPNISSMTRRGGAFMLLQTIWRRRRTV